MKKRVFAWMTALCLLTACTAGAESMKHERVFAVTDAQGQALSIQDSVRLENGDSLAVLEDATRLDQVENVGGEETFTRSGDALTWQAAGQDIRYQGSSTEALGVAPVVTVTLDGKEIPVAQLQDAVGELSLTVRYTANGTQPFAAVSLLLLDESLTDVTMEHGVIITDGVRRIAAGWGAAGLDSRAEAPDGFTLTAKADHADVKWMLTLATADPMDALVRELAEPAEDAQKLTDEVTQALLALQNGEELPAGEGETHETLEAVLALFTGADALSNGAGQLKEGADALDTGADTLVTGLTTLTDNNEALNQGAAQLFDAVLVTANQQLAAAGLDAAGLTLPVLTRDNYAEALQGALDQLDPETLAAQATEAVRGKVRAQVEKQEDAVRKAVEQAVREQVLTQALAQLNMTPEAYHQAVEAGKLPREQHQAVEHGVDEAMETPEMQATVEAALAEQLDSLTEEQLHAPQVQEQIQQAIAPAKAGYDALASLKQQLDSVQAFVTGVADYTAGVAQAAAGAAELHTGTTTLSAGMTELTDGVAELTSGLGDAKTKLLDDLLPLLQGDIQTALDVFKATQEQLTEAPSYDLVAPDMAHDLLYIIRTDLTR